MILQGESDIMTLAFRFLLSEREGISLGIDFGNKSLKLVNEF
jgi:hypothetical protein